MRHAWEVLRSPYYRSHLREAFWFTYAKWVYRKNRVATAEEFLAKALGLDCHQFSEDFERRQPLLAQAIEMVQAAGGEHGGVSMDDGQVLYMITRSVRPRIIIETGVAAGISTSFFLAALLDNGEGALYSIELPANEAQALVDAAGIVLDWPHRGVGWGIPGALRQEAGQNHRLTLGDVRVVLPNLLPELANVDIFFHDDLHTPGHMLWEYKLVWEHMGTGSLLISDDVNNGWREFCRDEGLPSKAFVNLNRLCAVRKP